MFAACLAALPAAVQGPSTPGRITAGTTVEGTLDDGDPRGGDDSPYDDWLFEGTAGQRIEIRLSSAAFDTYLWFGTWTGAALGDVRGLDDDGGGGTDSRLVLTLRDAGTYVVRANALRADGRGPYTLSIRTIQGERLPDAVPLSLTGLVSATGVLARDDAVLDDGSYYDLYSFAADRGQRVVVTMTSNDFDAFVGIGRVTNGVFDLWETDDDGAGGTDARLVFDVPSSGIWYIRANSFYGGRTGAYRVTLTLEDPGGEPGPS